MSALATFTKMRVHIPGVSIEFDAGSSSQFDEVHTAADADVLGQYQQVVFEMKNGSGSFDVKERGMFGIHWLNTTSGEVDSTWNTADFTAVESATSAFFTALQSRMANDVRYVESRWYKFGPGVGVPNPPSRVTTLGTPIAGTSATTFVRQVATNVTLRTALRKHWGRFYFPLRTELYLTLGQLVALDADALANAARTYLTASEASQGIIPVVYDRNRKQAFTVSSIEVDSVPDIQRRRRPRTSTYKKIITV